MSKERSDTALASEGLRNQLDSHKESIEIMVSEKSDFVKEMAKMETASKTKDGKFCCTYVQSIRDLVSVIENSK